MYKQKHKQKHKKSYSGVQSVHSQITHTKIQSQAQLCLTFFHFLIMLKYMLKMKLQNNLETGFVKKETFIWC